MLVSCFARTFDGAALLKVHGRYQSILPLRRRPGGVYRSADSLLEQLRMKRGASILVAAWLLLLGCGGLAHAQQNLFNVPSGRITPTGDVFFQEQINFQRQGTSNTTIDFGVWDELEVGLNLLDLLIYPASDRQAQDSNSVSDVLFNAQQGFPLTEDLHLALGIQAGVSSTVNRDRVEFACFNWVVLEQDAGDWGYFYLGGYSASNAYLGSGTNVGAMLGFEYPVVEELFSLMGDVLTGTNDISVAVLGGVYTVPNTNWQISLGCQLPFPGSHNDTGIVLEITRLPGTKRSGVGALASGAPMNSAMEALPRP
jgi:hypothetical protein